MRARILRPIILCLTTATAFAVTPYKISTDPFDASAVSQGTGDTLVMLPEDACYNREAAINRQDGTTLVLGDAYEIVWGTGWSDPICPQGADHLTFPIAINSSGVVVGRTVRSSDDFRNPLPWIWTEAEGFRALGAPGYLLNGGLSLNDAGVVVGSGNGNCNRSPESDFPTIGFVWTADDGAQPFNNLIDDFPAGYCIVSAARVNNLGQVAAELVNMGVDPNPDWPSQSVVLIPDYSPSAFNDNASVSEGVAQSIPVGVNDYNFTDPVTITITDAPMHGSITGISAQGPARDMTITYTPPADSNLTSDSFIYTVTDSNSGTDSATVNVRITDPHPNFFSFVDQVDVPPNSLVYSSAVSITGIDVGTPISIAGGEYAINNGAFRVAPSTIYNGQSVTVRLTSSATLGATSDATVTIGSFSDTFSVTVFSDSDNDGISDRQDNCIQTPNGPLALDGGGHSQLDTDGDGFGNKCDADLNNSGGNVNFADLAIFRAAFGSNNANADLNGSGGVNFSDLALFRGMFGKSPGPSGLGCAGTPACGP